MSTPVLHLLAGPNGAGKSTLAERVIVPVTKLPFVNADVIAAREWPGSEPEHAYDASRRAGAIRTEMLGRHASFVTETVFSHASKVDLVRLAVQRGYVVHLHVVLVPLDLSVVRVAERVRRGGHTVPTNKIRARYERLWELVARAAGVADRTTFYDNSSASQPFREVARLDRGVLVGRAGWPRWAPTAVTALGDPT